MLVNKPLPLIEMHKTNNIFLVGPMGAGKTTIGRGLAKLLNLTFYDSDHVIEERAGTDISWLFDVEGDEGFRKRERQVIEELTALNRIVLSTGGGSILDAENREHLKSRGLVIYLQTSLEQQVERTSRNPHRRPLLKDTHIPSKVVALNKIRNPLYEEVADLFFRTDSTRPQAVVSKIVRYIKKHDLLDMTERL
jgi:shikimate kinase